MDEKKVNQAVTFLNHPNVRGVNREKQMSFLRGKGLSEAEITEAYKRQSTTGTKVDLPSDSAPVSSSLFLSLRKQNLTELPDLSPHCNITVMNISLNQVKSLPREIGKLRALTTLNAQQNLITNAGLPAEFFELETLKDVNLSYNRLTTLVGFQGLSALTRLNVASNEIEEVPDEFVELQTLEVVLLHNNKLKSVSPCLALIRGLKQITLVGNGSLPEGLKRAAKKGLQAILEELTNSV